MMETDSDEFDCDAIADDEPETIRFTVDMTPQLHQALSEAAKRLQRPKAVLVRRAIAQLLKDLKDDAVIG